MNKEKNLLTVTEAAAYLGISTGTLRRWAQETKIIGVKIGSRGDWRFTRNELDGLIKPPRKNIPAEPFSQIQNLLNSHAEEITKMATREHLDLLGKQNTRSKVLFEYEKLHAQLVKELANHLEPKNLPSAIDTFKELGSAFGKQSVKEGITIEEAANGIVFLKQAIWKKMKTAGLLEDFTCEEFYELSQIIGTLTDTLSSQIAFTYHGVFANTQEQYRQQNEKYQTLFNSIDEGFCVFDLICDESGKPVDWIYLDANPAFVQQTGYKDPIGKKISELQPDLGGKWFRKFGEVLRTGKSVRFIEDAPEQQKWFEVYAFKVGGKKSTKISLLFTDITERIKIEDALQASKERFQVTFDQAAVGMAHVSIDGHWLMVNQKLCDIVGYTKNELLKLSFQDITYPDDLNADVNYAQQLLAGKIDSYSMEKRYIKKDKSTVWINLTGSLVRDNNNNPKYFISVIEDISIRKAIEEALQESEEKYRLVVENTLDLISIFDLKGRFIYASPSYKDVLGFTPTSLVGQSLFEPPDLNDAKQLRDIFQKILKGEKIRRFTTKGIDRHGNIHILESSGSAIFDGNNNPQMVVSVAHDVTERVKQEKRKDDFIAMASHELKTPLTSTKLFTQVLERKFGKHMDKESKKILSKMDDNINKLDELIKSLLDVSRIQQGKLQVSLEKFLIKELVQDIIEDIQPITEHKLVLNWKTKLYVYADKERVRQVLVNLITNAIKYSPDADTVIIGSRKKGNFIEIYVKDFGIGIPAAEQEKIFDRFYQVNSHNTYPGLGLGLYISSEIVKANGGKMWVTSEVGKGSTFYFTLPVYQKS